MAEVGVSFDPDDVLEGATLKFKCGEYEGEGGAAEFDEYYSAGDCTMYPHQWMTILDGAKEIIQLINDNRKKAAAAGVID